MKKSSTSNLVILQSDFFKVLFIHVFFIFIIVVVIAIIMNSFFLIGESWYL